LLLLLKAGIITTAKPFSDHSTVDLALFPGLKRISAMFGIYLSKKQVAAAKLPNKGLTGQRTVLPRQTQWRSCILSKVGLQKGREVVLDCLTQRATMNRVENKNDLRAIVKVRFILFFSLP
jgi:hypothetical protein